MTDLLLQMIASYGLPVLAVTVLLASLGIPLPGTILLVLAGAFVPGGDINLVSLVLVALLAAVSGDLLAYFIGRTGGATLEARVAKSPKRQKQFQRARDFSQKWGGMGVFFSRWLVAPVGPWINYASGISRFGLPGFLFWDILGEAVWVGLYVSLGVYFSENALALAGVLAEASWVLLGLLAIYVMGRKLYKAAKTT